MTWESLSAHDQSLQLIRVLKAMSMSDEQLDPAELDFIRQVGRQQGLSLSEIEEEFASNADKVAIPEAEQDRMTVLYYLVFLMKSDEKITTAEQASIHHFGLKLGFRDEMITDFITLAELHRRGNIPPQDMLAVVRKFLN